MIDVTILRGNELIVSSKDAEKTTSILQGSGLTVNSQKFNASPLATNGNEHKLTITKNGADPSLAEMKRAQTDLDAGGVPNRHGTMGGSLQKSSRELTQIEKEIDAQGAQQQNKALEGLERSATAVRIDAQKNKPPEEQHALNEAHSEALKENKARDQKAAQLRQSRPSGATLSSHAQSQNIAQKQERKRAAQLRSGQQHQNNAAAMSSANASNRAPAQQPTPQKKGVKGGMVLFWLVAGLALGKDIIDILTSLLGLVGLGLSATVIGAPVGVAIDFLTGIVDFISGLFIDFTMFAYFAYIGGKLNRRFAVMSIGAIIEMIPGLNILPMTTVMFFLAYFVGKIGITKITSLASKTSIGRKLLST